jgi:bis(5'-nucleosyl)-tetraphosphatase (symmetrical)
VAKRQRIFVGDVQGCADELDIVLERARQAFGDGFELWVVGDLVNRGPDNVRALERVRALVDSGRGHYVLGNHEIALLRVVAGLRPLSPLDSFSDVLGRKDAAEWIEWLRRRPLAVAGRLGRQRFAMAHAALHPEWDLDRQLEGARRVEGRLGHRDRREFLRLLAADRSGDADRDLLGRLTSCRSVGPDGDWSTQPPGEGGLGEAWHARWAARGHRYGVVYGHWSLQGLQVATWLRGLDTGCVHHGRGRDGALTAWLPDPDAATPFDVPDDRFWRVPARRAYYAQRDAVG